jgi:hypothetical protein
MHQTADLAQLIAALAWLVAIDKSSGSGRSAP